MTWVSITKEVHHIRAGFKSCGCSHESRVCKTDRSCRRPGNGRGSPSARRCRACDQSANSERDEIQQGDPGVGNWKVTEPVLDHPECDPGRGSTTHETGAHG